jgi:hypothetical protein
MTRMEQDRPPEVIISYKPRGRKLQGDLQKMFLLEAETSCRPIHVHRRRRRGIYITQTEIGK